MVVPLQFRMGMGMDGTVAGILVNVEMTVTVGVLMGMHQIAVAVGMGVDVDMLVAVLKLDGVFCHKQGAENHNNQSNIEL